MKIRHVHRSKSRSSSVEERPRRKLSKSESLKPVSNYLSSLLSAHGMVSIDTKVVVGDMMDRLVTGGYGWDRVIQYHARVSEEANDVTLLHNCYREKISSLRSSYLTSICQKIKCPKPLLLREFSLKYLNLLKSGILNSSTSLVMT